MKQGERKNERESERGQKSRRDTRLKYIQQIQVNANRIKCKQIAIELMKIY